MSLKYSLAAPQQEINLNQIPLSQLLTEGGKGFMHNINRGKIHVWHVKQATKRH